MKDKINKEKKGWKYWVGMYCIVASIGSSLVYPKKGVPEYIGSLFVFLLGLYLIRIKRKE